MFLYLFSIWFLSHFSYPAHTTPATLISQSADSVFLSIIPFSSTQKNVFLATNDGGTTWNDFTGNIPSEILPTCLWVDQKEWLIGAAQGLYKGSPGIRSANWTQESSIPKDITFFMPGKAGLYAVSHWNGIYQQQTASGRWVKVSGLLKNRPFFTFTETADGNLLGGCENGIFLSVDHGKSWNQVYENVGINEIKDYNGVLLACSWRGVLRSTDGGHHWEVSLPGNTTVFRTRAVEGGIVAFVEGQEFGGVRSPNEVMISKDNGITWKPMFNSVLKELKSVYDLVQVGDVLFAGANSGLYRSTDHGATWELIVKASPDQGGFFKLVIEGDTLYTLQVPGC